LPKKFLDLSSDSPGFVGKSALQTLQKEGGGKRRLVGLEIEGGLFSEGMTCKWNITSSDGNDGDTVGQIGSISFSYKMKKMIGIGEVFKEFGEPGQELQVMTKDGEVRSAVVRTFPFEGSA